MPQGPVDRQGETAQARLTDTFQLPQASSTRTAPREASELFCKHVLAWPSRLERSASSRFSSCSPTPSRRNGIDFGGHRRRAELPAKMAATRRPEPDRSGPSLLQHERDLRLRELSLSCSCNGPVSDTGIINGKFQLSMSEKNGHVTAIPQSACQLQDASCTATSDAYGELRDRGGARRGRAIGDARSRGKDALASATAPDLSARRRRPLQREHRLRHGCRPRSAGHSPRTASALTRSAISRLQAAIFSWSAPGLSSPTSPRARGYGGRGRHA